MSDIFVFLTLKSGCCCSNLHILTQLCQSRKKRLYPLMSLEFFSEASPTSLFIWLSRRGQGPTPNEQCNKMGIRHDQSWFLPGKENEPIFLEHLFPSICTNWGPEIKEGGVFLLCEKPRMSATMLYFSAPRTGPGSEQMLSQYVLTEGSSMCAFVD